MPIYKKWIHSLLILSILFNQNHVHAQKNPGLEVAGVAAVGLGLGLLNQSLAINEIQDYQEAMMLEDLIELGEVNTPSKLRVSTLCWKFNSYTDLYRANVMAFYVKKEDQEPFVYLKVIGNNRYQNEFGTLHTKSRIFKYDLRSWENVMIHILRNMDPENGSNYISPDSIVISNNKKRPPRVFPLAAIINLESRLIMFNSNFDGGGGFDVFHEIKRTYDDDHVLFDINSGLLQQEKLIADFTEKEIIIYIPSIKQSIMFKLSDILEIRKALQGGVSRQ
jgi:hypothetical protein